MISLAQDIQEAVPFEENSQKMSSKNVLKEIRTIELNHGLSGDHRAIDGLARKLLGLCSRGHPPLYHGSPRCVKRKGLEREPGQSPACVPHSPLDIEGPGCDLTHDSFQPAPLMGHHRKIQDLNPGFPSTVYK